MADDYSKRNNLSENQKEDYINIFKQHEMRMVNPAIKSDYNLRNEIIADLFAAQEISAFLIKEYKNTDSAIIMSCQIISLLHEFYSLFAIIKSTWNSILPLIRCSHIKKVCIDYTTENMVINVRNNLASVSMQNLLMLYYQYDYSKMDNISKKYLDFISYVQNENIINLFINPLNIEKIIDKDNTDFHIFI